MYLTRKCFHIAISAHET